MRERQTKDRAREIENIDIEFIVLCDLDWSMLTQQVDGLKYDWYDCLLVKVNVMVDQIDQTD